MAISSARRRDGQLTLPSNFYVITLSGDGYSPAESSGVGDRHSAGNPLRINFAKS